MKHKDKNKTDFFEEVDFFGFPKVLMEDDEYHSPRKPSESDSMVQKKQGLIGKYNVNAGHMKAGSGPGKVNSKAGNDYGEAPGGKPKYVEGAKGGDAKVNKLQGKLPMKYQGNAGVMEPKNALEKPHSKEGEEYDEKALEKSKVKTPEKPGEFKHMGEEKAAVCEKCGAPLKKVESEEKKDKEKDMADKKGC